MSAEILTLLCFFTFLLIDGILYFFILRTPIRNVSGIDISGIQKIEKQLARKSFERLLPAITAGRFDEIILNQLKRDRKIDPSLSLSEFGYTWKDLRRGVQTHHYNEALAHLRYLREGQITPYNFISFSKHLKRSKKSFEELGINKKELTFFALEAIAQEKEMHRRAIETNIHARPVESALESILKPA